MFQLGKTIVSEDIIQKETNAFIATVDSELKEKESDLLEI